MVPAYSCITGMRLGISQVTSSFTSMFSSRANLHALHKRAVRIVCDGIELGTAYDELESVAINGCAGLPRDFLCKT